MAINDNVKALTDEHGCIKDGQLASYVRCSMENKNLLQNKYDIYVGTGNYITDTSNESVSRETEGMNIISAVNAAAVGSSDGTYNPVKYARWAVEKNGENNVLNIENSNSNTDVYVIGNGVRTYTFKSAIDNPTSDVSVNVNAINAFENINTPKISRNPSGGLNEGGHINVTSEYVQTSVDINGQHKHLKVSKDGIEANSGNYTTTLNDSGFALDTTVSDRSLSIKAEDLLTNFDITIGARGGDRIACTMDTSTSDDRMIFSVSNKDNTSSVTIKKGTITATGEITAASFNAQSDARLKTNIKPFDYHNSILDVPVREYDWIKSGEHAIGFVAQELQEVYPELISEGEDGILRIKETKLVYLLIEEVKKLKKEVEDLKKEG